MSIAGRGPGAVNNNGGVVSIGYNTLAGNLTMANPATEGRVWATHGSTIVNGGVYLGGGASQIFQGNGDWVINGVVTGSEVANDRFIKTGQVIATTLWLKNANNSFTQSLRLDSGTARVSTNSALGLNVSTTAVDLQNASLEVRTDAPASFATRNVQQRSNTSGNIFVDHGMDGSLGIGAGLLGQTVTFGGFRTPVGSGQTATFAVNGRNGYGLSFTGATLAAGGGDGNVTININTNGLVTFNGDLQAINIGTTARTLTFGGNGDTLITGSFTPGGSGAHVFTKAGTGLTTINGSGSTYDGVTNISAGTLAFGNVGAFADSSQIRIGNATTTSGTLTYTGGTDQLTNDILLNTTTANVYLNASGTGTLTLSGGILSSVTGSKTLVLGGTGVAVLQGAVNNPSSGTISLQKIGGGTWTLSGANGFTGSTTISGGTLQLQDTFSGSSRNVISDGSAITFNADSFTQIAGGTLQYRGDTGSASSESLGALTATAGHGTVQALPVGGGSATLTFSSLGARTAGATINVLNTGAVNVTGTSAFVNAGTYFGGADFAFAGAGTTLRAPNYSTDAGFATSAAALTAGSHDEITGSFSTDTISINSLRINGANTLTLNAGQTLTIGTAAGSGIIQTGGSGAITGGTALATSAASNDLTVRVDGSGNTLSIDTPITTSTAGLTKSGAGTLTLSGANTYSGTVNVNEGTLKLAGSGLLGATNIGLNVRQDATFDLNGVNVGTIASGNNSVNALNGAGTITNSGALAALRVGNNNSSGYFTGLITGTVSLVKAGSGSLSLTSANTFTGPVVLSGGTLAVTSLADIGTPSALGAGDNTDAASNAASLVFNGGTLQYTGANATIFQVRQTPSVSIDRLFTIGLPSSAGAVTGTIDSSPSYGNGVLARNNNSAALVFNNTGDIVFQGTGTRTLTLTGDSIGDNQLRTHLVDNGASAFALTKAGGALWILNPATSNTYTGETTVSGGALRVAPEGATVQGLPTTSLLTLNGGVLETSGTFTRALGATQGANQVRLTGGASGFSAATADRLVVTIGGGALTWGDPNFNPSQLVLNSSTALGEVEMTNDINLGSSARTITVNNNSSTGTMVTAGILSGVLSGSAAITKAGGGVLMLGDANTYTGNTTVTGGNLIVTSVGGAAASSSLGGVGGTLIYNPGDSDLNVLNYVGAGETAGRAITFTSSSQHSTNRTYRIDSSGSGALVLNGTFTNTVTENGSGRTITLELRGSNTDLNQLNMVLKNSTGTNTPVLAVSKNDGGIWVLNPATPNLFTGNITVSGGTLGLTSNGIGSAGAVVLNNGGIFAFGGPLTISRPVQISANTAGIFSGSNAITLGNTLTGNSSNPWTISNNLENGALLTINGNFINAESGTTARTLNIRGYGSTVISGSILNSATSLTRLDIRIADTASVTLNGDNTVANGLTNGILLGQGTLIVGNAAALGGATNTLILDGGVLSSNVDLSGANKMLNKVQLQGDQVTVNGSQNIEFGGIVDENGNRFLRNELGTGKTLTLSGTVNLSSDNTARTLTLRGAGTTTISGVVANGGTGAGGLAYSGLNTLTLTNANTATGALTVNRNTVVLSGAGASGGAWAGTVTVNPIGILRLDNGAGNTTAGTTSNRLSDTNTFTGQGGTLDIIGATGGTNETVGPLTLNSVQTFITLTDNSGGAGNTLTFASVNFANSGSSLNLAGIPQLGTTNKVKFTTAPSGNGLVNSIMPRTFIAGGTFATYDATDGVKAFTNYNPTSTTDINLAQATDTVDANAGLTTSNLTANRTVNALRLNGSGISVGGTGRTLAVTSGGILNTGGNNTLDVSMVNFPTNTAYIQVDAGTTLFVNSALTGGVNFAKALPGTLQLNTPSFATGTHNILRGTLKLNGGLNTMFPGQLTNINDGAILDLNGNTQLVGQLSDPGVLPEAGGTIISSSGTGTLVANSGTSSAVATNINGNVNFAKAGSNTITLESINTYNGSTTLLGGTLQLQDDSTILNTTSIDINAATLTLNNNSSLQRAVYDRVGDTTPITLRDGTIIFSGKVSDPSSETFGALTSAQGANVVTANTGGTGTAGAFTSVDLTFASLTRNAGTTINFTGSNLGQQGNNSRIVFTTPLTTVGNGILGAWAIANSTDYAAYNTGSGIGVVGQGGYAGYQGTFVSGNITEIPSTAATTTTLPAGTTTTGLLKISGGFTNNIEFTNANDVLNLELGGLLRSNNNNPTTIGTTTTPGVLTAGGTETSGIRELIVYNNQNTVTINSVIADNGLGNSVKLIKSGGGTLSLTANNTYTGGTNVVQGTITLNGSGVVIPAGGIVLGGATMTMVTNAGQIDPSNSVTLRRSSTLTLVGSNTLDSLVFENTGGTSNPTVTISSGQTLTLTNSAPVSVTTTNVGTTPVISGGFLAIGAGTNTFNIGDIQVAGQTYTRINPSLSITSAITGIGSSITKTGDGILQLSGQSTFTGGLSLNAGGILISTNSSPTSGGTGFTGSPLGAGSVSAAAGTRFLVDGSRTVGNDIAFAGTPTFDSTAPTNWTLTLNGSLTGAGFTGPTPTIQITNPNLTVALLGNIPSIGSITSFNKTGLGTLIFNSTGYAGDFNATALGNPNAVSLLHDGTSPNIGNSVVETIALGNVIFEPGITGTITVGRAGGSLPFNLAANKILQPASISNLGSGLTVTNNSGYGLLASASITLTGTPTFSVANASNSNVTQGLYLTGVLSGTGFTKTGAGAVVLGNTGNSFTGDIAVNQGTVSVGDNLQLGNAANTVVLSPTTGTSTFRATDNITTSRTIQLANTANTRAIEVVGGKTLQLDTAFDLNSGAGAAASLMKADRGTLVLTADNSAWSGAFTIAGGAVKTGLAASLGTGALTVGNPGAALQLQNNITVANPITIAFTSGSGGDNTVFTGLNTGGAIESVSGANTISNAITVTNTDSSTDSRTRTFGFGADTGATLTLGGNINFNHSNTGSSRNVIAYFGGGGDITLNGVLDNTNGTPAANSYAFKLGDGTLTLTAANAMPDTEFRVYRGGVTLNGAGTFGTASTQVQVWQNGTLTIDNSTTNTANRISNRVLQIGGGTLNYIPNSVGTTQTSTGALQISGGLNTINLGSGGDLTVTFASLTQNSGSVLNMTGTFGTTTNKLTFTTAPTLSPTSGGLLARVLTNGTEFATYSTATGISTFTGYAAATNILSTTATQTFNATDTTANSLTGNQTLNALKITSGSGTTNVGGLGGLTPTTLTLTSGGILADGTGAGSTLSVPVVAVGGAEAILHVLSGQTLDVSSGFSGTGGMNKTSGGTLNLNSQQFVSNNTYVNGGTLNLTPGATNTLLFNNGLGVNIGATVDLKNGVQFIGSLFSSNGGGNTDLGGGTVTNSGAEATLVTNSNSSFNGHITGTIFLNKTGTNGLGLEDTNTFSGAVLINGGSITLQDKGTMPNVTSFTIARAGLTITDGNLYNLTNRVKDTAPITMYGGNVSLNGRQQDDVSETVGAVTLVDGHNSIFASLGGTGINTVDLTFGGFSRSVGSTATLRFNSLGSIGLLGSGAHIYVTGGIPLTNHLIGPWAIVDREFATYDDTYGVSALAQAGMAGYDGSGLNSNPLPTDNVRLTATGTTALLTDTTVGTLNFGQQGSTTTLDLSGHKLTIQGGGLLFGQGTDNVNFAITNGNLTGPSGGGDLYITHANFAGTNRTVSIDAAITDNGGPVRIIKTSGDTGTSVMTWNGVNTYTGGTVINQGTLVLGATGQLGTGGITVNVGALTQTAGGVIPSQMLTMNGGSTVTLANQANSLAGIAFNADGGASPTLNATGTLTLTGGITSTPTSAGAVAIIANGTVDLNGAGSYSINVAPTIVNGKDVAPWQSGLTINAVIQNGGIVKSGGGMLQLGAQNTFVGGVTVNAGGLVLAASSTPNGIGETVLSGPLGSGTLRMADGTSLVATTAVTVSNNVVFGDDGAGTGTHVFNGINSITLNGLTTLPSTWNATVTAPQTTVTIADAHLSLSTDVINKSGLGSLNVGSYNGTILATGGLVFFGDGNGLGTPETLFLGGNLTIAGDTAITVNHSGSAPNGRNKILQKGNLIAPGNIVSISNQNGYGLEFTGTTTMSGPSHFAVSVASASNVVQGLVLSGVVDDGASNFDLTKSGPGTLVLGNAANTFGGAGKTIDILNGVVSVGSDGALGDPANTITLDVDSGAGVGLRVTDSFMTGRTIRLNQLNNAIEVVQDKFLAVTAPFEFPSATNTLFKNDSGQLALLAANPNTWTGGVTINGGSVIAFDAGAFGSPSAVVTISPNVAATGAALQLANNITLPNPINLQGNNNVAFGGINVVNQLFGGQLQSVSGANTVTGILTMNFDAAIGADAGATLNINGGINNTTTSGRALLFTGAGIINLNSDLTAATTTANQYYSLNKYGTGTLNITTAQTVVPTNSLTLFAGTTNISGNGTLTLGNTIAATVNGGATLTVSDNGGISPIANRLGGRPLALSGGSFNYVGNPGNSSETIGALTVNRAGAVISTDPNGGNLLLTFASLTANSDSSISFVGTNLGSANNKVVFTSAPTLTPSSGGILARATVNGTNFATIGANGIAAFTNYNPTSTTNINSASATDTVEVSSAMGTHSLTASKTINALKINGSGLDVSGAALNALTLASGGVLVTGGNSNTISVPLLTAAAQQVYHVDSGSELTVTSTLTGSTGLVKTGAGTLILQPPAGSILNRSANTLTGNVAVNNGTLRLAGGNNTLPANQFMIIGPGGILDLNGNSQYVSGLLTDAAVPFLDPAQGGIVTGGVNPASTLVMNQDNNSRNWAGHLTGALSLLRTGQNTLSVYSDNDYTGHTLIGGGTTTLRDAGRLSRTSDIEIVYATLNLDNNTGQAAFSDRINDAAPIGLRGGTLGFVGRAQTLSTETVGNVTLRRGMSTITSAAGGTGVNSADFTLSGLAQEANSGATVLFSSNLGAIGSAARVLVNTLNGNANANTTARAGLTNNIIGGWAITGNNEFATYIPGLGIASLNQAGAPQYDRTNTFTAAAPTDNIRLTSTTTLPGGGATVNAVTMTGSAINLNFSAGSDILNLVSGGLIGPNSGQTIGTTTTRGVLTAGGAASSGTSDLYLYNRSNTVTLNSQVVDTATAIGSGTGKVRLVLTAAGGAITLGNGTNSYTGGTVVNGGTVNLNATTGTVAIPAATDPAAGLIINGGTVTMQNTAGQIAASNIVTFNGNAVLNLVGDNTVAGLIFRDDGGGTSGTGINSNSGTLTINGNVVSTTANPASTSVLNGRYNFGTTQRTLDISATRFNSQELAALLSDFNVQGIEGSSGGIVKEGDGVLQFNAVDTYTGPTIVNNGRLQIGTANGGSRFSAYNLASGTLLNLNGTNTILGSIEGAGQISNSSTTTGTLTVGFNNNSTTYSGTFDRFNDATLAPLNLTKVGSGTLTLTSNASTSGGTLTINRGTVTYKDAGVRNFTTAATVVNEGGTLTLDNTGTLNVNNRLGGTGALTLNGGVFNLLGSDATATTELGSTLTLGPSASAINLTPGNSGGTVTVTFSSLSQGASGTALISGTNLGTDSKLLFTTAPTLTPASTGILPRLAVGTDFATYNATNGVIAFTGYTTPADINSAASTATIKVDSTTTGRNLTAARTINAIDIIEDNVTIGSSVGLLPIQGWTLTSGGVLANGNNATLSTPVLAFGGAEGIFRVNGSSINVTSSITGTAGITKTGSGSMTLSSAQSYTGATAVNLGTLTLAAGNNTLLVVPSGGTPTVADLQVNGGVFNLNGNNQAVRTLLDSNTLAFIAGEITNSSATAVTLTTAMNTSSTFGGTLTGNLGLTRSGNNTLTLVDAHTYTGPTTVRGGGLTLQDRGSLTTSSISLYFGALTLSNNNLNPLASLNPVRLAPAMPLTMQGGTFVITPGGSVDNSTTLNTVTILAGGGNTITPNGVVAGTNTINIGNLILPTNSGTTLHFSTDPGQPTSSGAQVFLTQFNGVTPVNNAFLGANVILNSGEYGVYNSLQGVIRFGASAITGNTVPAYATTLASGNNLPANVSSTGSDVAISANTTIGALRLTGAATRNITFTAGTEVLNLALGGLLRDNNNNSTNIGTTTARGVLTTGGTAATGTTDLVEFHNQSTVTIHSVIADNGLGNKTRFVKAGPAGTTLTAANSYTGGTVVNSGTLTINATAGAGTVVIPAGGITLNNANLTMSTNQGQVDATNDVTINGGGVLTLTGTNTLNSVSFSSIGGNATPTVAVGTQLTLSSLSPITVSDDNYSFTPTISGTELVLQDGAAISTSGLSPDDLIISAKLSTVAATTPLIKTGAGSLILSSNTSAFANGFNLNQGTLIFANNSAGTPPAVTAGPVGTGTLSLADGVAIMSDGTGHTIGNAVNVAGNFTFGPLASTGVRGNSGSNLTLSGTVSLAAGAHAINVNGLLMVATISGQLTGGTDLSITGPGILSLANNANDYGGVTTVNSGGTLRTGSATPIPATSLLTINPGGYLDAISNPFITQLAGTGVIGNSASSTLSVGGNAANDVTTNQDNTFAGVIGNTLNLQKVGLGKLTLTGQNVYTGTTTIMAGTLSGGAANTFSPSSTVTIGNGATSNGTTTATFDTGAFDQVIGGLNSATESAAGSAILNIPSGKTLSVAGNVVIGSTAALATTTNLTATGGGTLTVVNSASGAQFRAGGSSSSGNFTTADLSGLSALNVSLNTTDGVFRVNSITGTNVAGKSTLILAENNSVTAKALVVGDGGQFVGATDQVNALKLGAGTNTFNVDSFNIGTGARDFGSVTFNGSNGSLTVRDATGAGRAALNIGTTGGATGVSTGTNDRNTFDVTGHNADLLFGAVAIGTQATRGDTLTSTFSFDQGSLDMTSLTMSVKTGTPLAGAHVTNSTVNLGGGNVTIGSGILQMGQTSTSDNAATATVNVSGGTVNIGATSGTAINMASAGSGTAATAVVNLTGGTTTVNGDILRAGGAGTTSATVNLSGGTLDMSGKAIGSSSSTVNFNAQSGTLQNLGELNGGAALTKTTTGTLTLAGSNSYTGPTNVAAGGGTLEISGSINATASVQLDGGTLLLTGGNERVSDSAGVTMNSGTLAFGNSVVNATETLGLLTLSANSTLDFGSFSLQPTDVGNTFHFASFAPNGFTLNVYNWSGAAYTYPPEADHGDPQDRLLFNAISDSDAAQINFYSDEGLTLLGNGAQISFNSSYEVVPVPEPSSTGLIGAAGLLALVGYRERRRLGAKSPRRHKPQLPV